MEGLNFAPRTFDEFLAGKGIFWFCDDSYKVTPRDMDRYVREKKTMGTQNVLGYRAPSANIICTSHAVYFNYPENVQPAPSPASCQTPRIASTSSLMSISGERHQVSCTFCRMPLCGEVIVCKGREQKYAAAAELPKVKEQRCC